MKFPRCAFSELSRPQGLTGCTLLGLLLTPVAASAAALAAWRFGVDTGWTSRFFIAGGFLSHWQVWVRLPSVRKSVLTEARCGI